jgi:hypothetical protein
MSTIVAVAASSVAIQASQRAHEAKLVACKSVVQTYDAAKATIGDMQQYSDCVQTLFPTDGNIPTWFVKVLIVSALIGIVAGVWRTHKSFFYYRDEWSMYVVNGLIGMMAVPLGVMLLCGMFVSIKYLFS